MTPIWIEIKIVRQLSSHIYCNSRQSKRKLPFSSTRYMFSEKTWNTTLKEILLDHLQDLTDDQSLPCVIKTLRDTKINAGQLPLPRWKLSMCSPDPQYIATAMIFEWVAARDGRPPLRLTFTQPEAPTKPELSRLHQAPPKPPSSIWSRCRSSKRDAVFPYK